MVSILVKSKPHPATLCNREEGYRAVFGFIKSARKGAAAKLRITKEEQAEFTRRKRARRRSAFERSLAAVTLH